MQLETGYGPALWIVLALCAFGIGLSKGGFTGVGILPVAIFALVLPPRDALGVVLPLLICGDCLAVALFRRHAAWPHLQRLFPWAATGIVLGFLMLWRLQTNHYDTKVVNHQLGRMIGLILIALIALHGWRRHKLALAKKSSQGQTLTKESGGQEQAAILVPEHGWQVVLVGVVAGFTTMVANASGPILVIYLLAMRLPKMQFIGTAAWFFLILNLFKVPFMALLHLVNISSLMLDVKLFPAVIAGVLTGQRIIPHVNQPLFENIALTLTLLTALRMLI